MYFQFLSRLHIFLWVGYYVQVLTKGKVYVPEIAGKFSADNCL